MNALCFRAGLMGSEKPTQYVNDDPPDDKGGAGDAGAGWLVKLHNRLNSLL